MKRLGVLISLAAIAFGAVIYLSTRSVSPGASIGGTELGVPVGGQNAYEFAGRIDQNGAIFTGYGFLTHLAGLTDTLLFSSTNPLGTTAAQARFTYYTNAMMTSVHVLTNTVFIVDGDGTTVFYFNKNPSANFANPLSFAAGTPILTSTVHFQSVVVAQSPDAGVATGVGNVKQTGVMTFTLNGQDYHIGRVGLFERLQTTGESVRTNPVAPASWQYQGGYAVVTGVPGQSLFYPIITRDTP